MLEPRHESDCVDIIREQRRLGGAIEIVGGGTKRTLGHAVRADVTVSTRGLSGITAYNPAEMVMTALAGTPMSRIEAALAANRQMLAFEPPDMRGLLGSAGEPTIGGLFACNLSGPRRFQAGAARDHLLGVRFINGLGEVVRTGGRVMKNVTGLDLVKLMAGSHGVLGFMTELTFKVLPRPETEATLVLSESDGAQSARIMAEALATPYEISGAACLPVSCSHRFVEGKLGHSGATALRIEGPAFSVRERMAKLREAFAARAPLSILQAEESAALWRDIRDVRPFVADGRDRPVWKVSVAPMAGHQLLSALRMQTGLDGYYDWQGGLLWLRMEAEPEAELLRAGIRHFGGGHATLFRATDAERAAIPVFEPQAPAVAALSESVRASIDPDRIFNPGRMTPVGSEAEAA